jgi:formylglycine-generating enzyme
MENPPLRVKRGSLKADPLGMRRALRPLALLALVTCVAIPLFAVNVVDDLVGNDLDGFKRKVALLDIDLRQEPYLAIYLKGAKEIKHEVVQYLVDAGAGIDAPDEERGLPPLVWAISRDDSWAVDLLLKAGANPNARLPGLESMLEYFGSDCAELSVTPLYYAAMFDSGSSTKALLTKGAKPSLQVLARKGPRAEPSPSASASAAPSYGPAQGRATPAPTPTPVAGVDGWVGLKSSLMEYSLHFYAWSAARELWLWDPSLSQAPVADSFKDITFWIVTGDMQRVKRFLATDSGDSLRLFPCAIDAEVVPAIELLVKLNQGKPLRFDWGDSQTSALLLAMKDKKRVAGDALVKALGLAVPEESKVEPGNFQMGASDGLVADKPVHQVSLTVPYALALNETTRALWTAVMGQDPSKNRDSMDQPVDTVGWAEAASFCNALSWAFGLEPCYEISDKGLKCDFAKKGYRLPTEAEWEFAARGGKLSRGYKYSGSQDAEPVGWHSANAAAKSHPVKQKQANELGLFDMSGNLWEWCWDVFASYKPGAQTDPKGEAEGSARVLRGGGYDMGPGFMRTSLRDSKDQGYKGAAIGFRLARTL